MRSIATQQRFEKCKAAAAGRWRVIFQALAPELIPALDAGPSGKVHCPMPGHDDVNPSFRIDKPDEGRAICTCGSYDGIGLIARLRGWHCLRVACEIEKVTGVSDCQGNGKINGHDLLRDVAALKRISVDSLKAYGATVADRGGTPVVRLPAYNELGKAHSHFDLGTAGKLKKGLFRQGRGSAGLFFPGRLPQAGEDWILAEGPKDPCAYHGLGYLACGLNTDQMATKYARLFAGCNITIMPDRTVSAEAKARQTAGRLHGVAASVRIGTLPLDISGAKGDDARDVLKLDGGEAMLRRAIADAQLWQPGDGSADDGRVRIPVTTDEYAVNSQAATALAKDDSIYQRGGLLVHIVHEARRNDGITRAAGAPTIANLPEAILRERLTRCVHFTQERGSGDDVIEVSAHPPGWCVKAISQRGYWDKIRALTAVVPSPVLRPDGTVLQCVGYDDRTGLYCADNADIDVSEHPSKDEALRAVGALLDVVCDFPFGRPEHRAAWLAFVLTPLARHAFYGPAPLFLTDANIRASGKTLLCELGSIIAYGRDIARMSNPSDDDEARKRITALAIAGDPLVLLDNIVGRLGCASLDAALTATVWKDRILGISRMVELPLCVTWCASGNNVMIAADTTRRTLHIRLESPMENPELRTGFKHPNVTEYALLHRSRLLSAALTILRAYCCAGRPRCGLPAWGSFEGWSSLVREAVVWCGLPDPAATRQELADIADTEAAALRELLDAWPEIDPDNYGLTTAELLDLLHSEPGKYPNVQSAIVELCPPTSGPLPGVRQLGNRLAHVRRRIIGGIALDYRQRRGRQRAWLLVGDSGDSSDSFSSLRGNETDSTYEKFTGAGKSHLSHQSHPSDSDLCDDGGPHAWIDDLESDGKTRRFCRKCNDFAGFVQPDGSVRQP